MVKTLVRDYIACVARVNGRGERGGGAKKERGRREGTPAIRTGLFALHPPLSLSPTGFLVNMFTNQKLAHAFMHG